MDRIFLIGIIATLFGVICNLVFLIYTIKHKITKGIRYPQLSLVILTDLLWLWYSIKIKSAPLIISSILSLVIISTVILLKIIYEKKKIAAHFKEKKCRCSKSCSCNCGLDK